MRSVSFWLLLSIPMLGIAAPAISLCDQTEEVIFNCTVVGSTKLISLCASPKLTKDQGYLQYRFGKKGKIELVFPAERNRSQGKFRYAHYFRAQVDRTEISFTSADYEYTIFSYDEAEEKPAMHEAGLSVVNKNQTSRSAVFECKKPVQAKFDAIDYVIPCDKENALNLNECK